MNYDNELRAPLDYGAGSKKSMTLKCRCGKYISVRTSTFRVRCSNCNYAMDKSEFDSNKCDSEIEKDFGRPLLQTPFTSLKNKAETRAYRWKNWNSARESGKISRKIPFRNIKRWD